MNATIADLPVICFHFGVKTGWAAGLPSLLSSGTVDWEATNKKAGLDLPAFGGWLGEIARTQPWFSQVAVVDTEIEGKLALVDTVEFWARNVGTTVRTISPADVKRAVSGPYATRGEVLEWARQRFPSQRVQSYEQAAALVAFYLCQR